jgi:hypothetical protein
MILLLLCSCSEFDSLMNSGGQRLSASVEESAHVTTRLAPNYYGVMTFETDDHIRVWWDTQHQYNFKYTGSGNLFTPINDNDKRLWDDLSKETAASVPLYGQYMASDAALQANNGANFSVLADQSLVLANYRQPMSYLLANQSVADKGGDISLSFKQMMARMILNVTSTDPTLTNAEISQAQALIKNVYISGTIETDATTKEKSLKSNTSTLTDVQFYNSGRSGKTVTFKCLLPSQKLTDADNKIIITMGNGKVFYCTLGKDVTLVGGNDEVINITLKSGGTSVLEPVASLFNGAASVSGNRLVSIETVSGSTNQHIFVYEKKADGTWDTDNKKLVYAAEKVDYAFLDDSHLPNNDTKFVGTEVKARVYGDNMIITFPSLALTPTDYRNDNVRTFFAKKNATGKWFATNYNSPATENGYDLVINSNFAVSGNHNGAVRKTYVSVYPIDNNGVSYDASSASTYQKSDIYGYKMALAENNILVTCSGLYQLSLNGSSPSVTRLVRGWHGNEDKGYRVNTDGIRVILQDGGYIGGGTGYVSIYNIATGLYENFKDGIQPRSDTGHPIAIWGNYAFVGGNKFCQVWYNNKGVWTKLNDDLLVIAQNYCKDNSARDALKTYTAMDGFNIEFKGTQFTSYKFYKGTDPVDQTLIIDNAQIMLNNYLEDHPVE